MKRKEFIYKSIAATSVLGAAACSAKNSFKVNGVDDSKIGHLLNTKIDVTNLVDHNITHDVLIVGGGISALSAARVLKKQNIDFAIVEMMPGLGGNSISGSYKDNSFPWGAHYLPIPNIDLVEVIDFLKEANIITSFKNGTPFYNEAYLCFDPKERLYVNGLWQDGLIPQHGISNNDKVQIEKFLVFINELKNKRAGNGTYVFQFPVKKHFATSEFAALDQLSAKDWLFNNGYTSSYLHQYIIYCLRDDYGAYYDSISAFAMLHYFAVRKGIGGNCSPNDVLTWPQGNYFLVEKFIELVQPKTYTNNICLEI
jgi:phytoene dehydrogenase-like protein